MAQTIALTIAGSDSSGGAGIQADLKTFAAHGVYGASVITALTAQNTQGVQGLFMADASFVALQIKSVFDDLDVKAVKVGMLGADDIVEAVAQALEPHGEVPIVLDPVLVATSGDKLTDGNIGDALKTHMFPVARLITPNIAEAETLLGRQIRPVSASIVDAARELCALGCRSVLITGGDIDGEMALDVFCDGKAALELMTPKIATKNTHGTGCTLSSAIAANLAKGRELEAALQRAKEYVLGAISAGSDLKIGKGRGPVDHFHAIGPDSSTRQD